MTLQHVTLLEAQKMALSILKQVMEEKLTNANIEMAYITPVKGKHTAKTQHENNCLASTLVIVCRLAMLLPR